MPNLLLTFHTGQVSALNLTFASQTCVFPKQSLDLFSGRSWFLLPKLRGGFAEFLDTSVGLWNFVLMYCVRYGYVSRKHSFSRQCGIRKLPYFSVPIALHHQETDCVPLDFVFSQVSNLRVSLSYRAHRSDDT